MSNAPSYIPHYSIEEYRLWEGDWELWFGVAVAMAPSPFAPHERLVSELSYQMTAQIKQQRCSCCVYMGLDWIVASDTVVRPDVMIICGEQPQKHLQRPPALIVEVLSPSTADKDRGAKRALYQQQRVPYYLLADPDAGTLDALRLLEDRYEAVERGEPLELQLPTGCRLQLPNAGLFG